MKQQTSWGGKTNGTASDYDETYAFKIRDIQYTATLKRLNDINENIFIKFLSEAP